MNDSTCHTYGILYDDHGIPCSALTFLVATGTFHLYSYNHYLVFTLLNGTCFHNTMTAIYETQPTKKGGGGGGDWDTSVKLSLLKHNRMQIRYLSNWFLLLLTKFSILCFHASKHSWKSYLGKLFRCSVLWLFVCLIPWKWVPFVKLFSFGNRGSSHEEISQTGWVFHCCNLEPTGEAIPQWLVDWWPQKMLPTYIFTL
jgi:hypothetical protein